MSIIGLSDEMYASDENWFGSFQEAAENLGSNIRVISTARSDWMRHTDGLDGFVWRPPMSDPTVMAEIRTKVPLLEAKGVSCFPNSLMLWLYDDKIRETYFLNQNGYSTPKTFISFEEREAREFAQSAQYPLVAKTHMGAAASGVIKIGSAREALKLIAKIFAPQTIWDKFKVKFYYSPVLARGSLLAARQFWYRNFCPRYVYFQEFIEGDCDWRITTLGPDLISCFVRRNRRGDFRASGSGQFEKVGEESIPVEACDLALKISNRHGFTSMAYDFMHSQTEWVIGEISYTFSLKPIYTETLFRKIGDTYRKVAPIPICQMHLQAMRESNHDTGMPVSPLILATNS